MSTAAAQAQSLLVQQTSNKRHEVIDLYKRCIRCAASIKDAGWRLSYLEYTRHSFRRNGRLPHSSCQAQDARNYAEEQLERMKYYISVNDHIQNARKESADKNVQAVLRPLSSLLSVVHEPSGRNAVKKVNFLSIDEAEDDFVNMSPPLAEDLPEEDIVVYGVESTENKTNDPYATEIEIDINQASVSSQLVGKDKDPEETQARLPNRFLSSDYTDQNAPLDLKAEKFISDEVDGKATTRTCEAPIHDTTGDHVVDLQHEDQVRSAGTVDLLKNVEIRRDGKVHMESASSKKEHKIVIAKGGSVMKRSKLPSSKQKISISRVEENNKSKVELKSFDAIVSVNMHKSIDEGIITKSVSPSSEESNDTNQASIDSAGEEKFGGAAALRTDVKEQTIESFLKEAVPFLYSLDIQTYTKHLVDDGFDSVPMVVNELLREDLHFMKKAHARAVWNFIETKRK